MKNKTKLVIALSLILCLTASVGFTLAYFTDYESAKGGAVVDLTLIWLFVSKSSAMKIT